MIKPRLSHPQWRLSLPARSMVGVGCTLIAFTLLGTIPPTLAQTTDEPVQQLLEASMKLYREGSPEARQSAIAKLTQALKLMQAAETAQPSPQPSAPPPAVADIVGLKFQDGDRLNVGSMVQERVVFEQIIQENGVEYVNQCPKGKKPIGFPHTTNHSTSVISSHAITPREINTPRLRGWFFSEKTPPAPGLRVVIRNVTRGFAKNPSPYTDRKYDQGAKSEAFWGTVNDEHDGKYFSFAIGNNDFTYEIKRGDQVIESGTFSATIDKVYRDTTDTQTIARPKVNLECKDK